MSESPYIGRFAPSPTGPLHFGSLIAALASFLEARRHHGRWLVRMEDVDELRNVDGAADDILFTLEAYGFEWDGEVMYQTRRKEAYQAALEQLAAEDRIYRCTCSRRDLQELAEPGAHGLIYPGICAASRHPEHVEHAIRLRTDDHPIRFNDAIMGEFSQNLAQDVGDFIIRRRDGLFAYQLAVVVDDAEQHISHVVRGVDLLDSTPRQMHLQHCLSLPTPNYAHLPLAVNARGDKLSKQTQAPAIEKRKAATTLVRALRFLGQQAETGLEHADIATVWQWALNDWDLAQIPNQQSIILPDNLI
ncbi:MAG: tRNA glutamyl-Q(34) synthetase GluQRS [Gammaproteobacteria bacterium]|nr:MAG: tRNA glutamyl-Q(34) synthetase GluQRS [Gammaproteobacteria bacterium]